MSVLCYVYSPTPFSFPPKNPYSLLKSHPFDSAFDLYCSLFAFKNLFRLLACSFFFRLVFFRIFSYPKKSEGVEFIAN